MKNWKYTIIGTRRFELITKYNSEYNLNRITEVPRHFSKAGFGFVIGRDFSFIYLPLGRLTPVLEGTVNENSILLRCKTGLGLQIGFLIFFFGSFISGLYLLDSTLGQLLFFGSLSAYMLLIGVRYIINKIVAKQFMLGLEGVALNEYFG